MTAAVSESPPLKDTLRGHGDSNSTNFNHAKEIYKEPWLKPFKTVHARLFSRAMGVLMPPRFNFKLCNTS